MPTLLILLYLLLLPLHSFPLIYHHISQEFAIPFKLFSRLARLVILSGQDLFPLEFRIKCSVETVFAAPYAIPLLPLPTYTLRIKSTALPVLPFICTSTVLFARSPFKEHIVNTSFLLMKSTASIILQQALPCLTPVALANVSSLTLPLEKISFSLSLTEDISVPNAHSQQWWTLQRPRRSTSRFFSLWRES